MLANLLIGLVALIHLYILYLETAAWDTPKGWAAFGLTPEFARATKTLAANQGLYNGFLAAGLLWGIFAPSFEFKVFFLLCVIVAGLYGAATTRKTKILYIQTAPASLAMAALLPGW
ncbi:DUF1304 domain-containing protein [Neomegalonema sp.]|uniref:DUF1304 domain-containing protein n=1 Tax=Neomegalonema sp. TaxID=2039713 RepID=UPI00263075D5|nr:DUF1304 domain-containing protein [Neomegalonema sp.]MDD2869130.1 DUF1304 domain-containing protein [Neomegalonema sp.]